MLLLKYMRKHALPCGDMIKKTHVAHGHPDHEWAIGHSHISLHIHGHAEMRETEKSGKQKKPRRRA